MKKLHFIFLFLTVFSFLYGCGIKSDLRHPNGDDFPRQYPVN